MDALEAIRTRRSIRKYAPTPVSEEQLANVLEAVRQAPTWANMQCCRLVVVRDPATRAGISELSFLESVLGPKGYKTNPSKKALAEAPVVIVLCADPAASGQAHGQSYYLVDAGIAAQNMMLAARAQGLGTVFVGIFQDEELHDLLGIPEQIRIVGLLPLGHPADEAKAGPKRRPLEEICFAEAWPKAPAPEAAG